MAGIWEEFLSIVKDEAGSRVVETWFKAISLDRWDILEKTAYLKAPNSFVKDWIQRHYMALIQLHLGRLLNSEMPKIVFLETTVPKNNSVAVVHISEKKLSIIPAVKKNNGIRKIHSHAYVNANYSFKDFVVGPSNALAHAAAHAVTEKPGILYNPLFIYGESGLGKTHLLHAIGNGIKENNPNCTVLYQTTDRFVNEFISAIRFNRVHKFQAKYQDIDVLLVDDVQFISNKEQTQEAFFHIFNLLHEGHKQIVFSGDTFPQNIEGIAERLRSRLAWGLVTDIHPPSLETKIAIVKKKVESNGENLADDVAHFIASKKHKSIRELEGSLVRVIAFASLTGQPITVSLAEKVLAHTDELEKVKIDLARVIECVKKHYTYGLSELRSQKRNANLSLARHVAMFLMKRVTNKSLRDIGSFLGGRNHATVVHAINKIKKRIDNDADFKNQVKKIEHELTQCY